MNTTTPAYAIKGGDRIIVQGRTVEVFDSVGGEERTTLRYLVGGQVRSLTVSAESLITLA